MNIHKSFKNKPLAYFCAEYALFNHTPLYAGGLGILAGDYISEIVSENFPAVAIGLFYHKEHQHGLKMGQKMKTPEELGLSLLKDNKGHTLIVPISVNNVDIFAQVWSWEKAEMQLFLLDTKIKENNEENQKICDTLYVEDRNFRLLQEIVLGIGGIKLIKTLGIQPSIYHMNEGHSAFLTLELIKNEIKDGKISFEQACKNVREYTVFTNHTLVTAGQELFDIEKIKSMFDTDMANLGFDEESKMFSMTRLALNMSCRVNAVSALHMKKAVEVWKGYRVESITNGINLDRWDSLKYYSHKESKRKLLALIREKCGMEVDENTLILGWARRFVEYKRPLAILENIERIKNIATKENRKVFIVFSSFINKTYERENELIRKLDALIDNELKGIVTFIPDYDMEIAKIMTSGCDIWLNTPKVGLEACGTSGMKACLNGVLPLTTSDGWVDEVDLSGIGWVVQDDDVNKNLLDTLEKEIIPEYYDNKEKWENRMKNSRTLIVDNFSTKRMLGEYKKKLYSVTF